jgi:hypothetical protein
MRFDPDSYITVAERVAAFYERFPQGRILTSIVQHNEETGFVLIRAEAYREPDDAWPAATGHAYELKSAGHVQAGSYVEVCETSSVGRALALLGFEVKRGVASREEVQRGERKAQSQRPPADIKTAPNAPPVKARDVDDSDALDTEISTLLSALERESAAFSAFVQKQYQVEGAWYDQSTELKRTLRDYLLGLQGKVKA